MVGSVSSTEFGTSDAMRSATAGGVMRSRPPEITTVGQPNFGISATRSYGSASKAAVCGIISRIATAGSSGSPSGSAA